MLSAPAFGAWVTYWDDFDDSSKYGNWNVTGGSFNFYEYGAGSGNFVYYGTPPNETDPAKSWFGIPDFYNISSSGIQMEAAFGMPDAGKATGLFFGASETDHHSAYLYNLGDDSQSIFLTFDFNYKTDHGADYSFKIGDSFADDTVFWMGFSVSEQNNIEWSVAYRDSTTDGNFVILHSFEDVLENGDFIPDLTGVSGVFTNGANAFGYFEVGHDDGSPVPVPAAAWLMASGLIGLAGLKRRKV